MSTNAKAKLVIPASGMRELSFTPGQSLADFLSANEINVEEYTIVLNGQSVTSADAAVTPVEDGDVIVPVAEVTNG